MRPAPIIQLSKTETALLRRLTRSNTASVREVQRAQMVLLAADGKSNTDIAIEIGVGRIQVGRWRQRYLEGGLAAIERDRQRTGRKPSVDAAEVVRRTTQTRPTNATHWTTRTLAAQMGISATTVRRVWHAHGLKLHRLETFKVSRDPALVEILQDIVGLYLNPPAHALVLCCDE